MLPVRGREIIECQQLVTIFGQTPGGLGRVEKTGLGTTTKDKIGNAVRPPLGAVAQTQQQRFPASRLGSPPVGSPPVGSPPVGSPPGFVTAVTSGRG